MNTLMALEALFTMIGAVEGVPQGIKDFAALIHKARSEGRDISPDEIAMLKLDDDEARATLDAAIAKADRSAKA